MRTAARPPRTTSAPRPISWRRGSSTALTVQGYGIRLFVNRGRLLIEDGFANEGARRRIILTRGTCRLQRIVMVGRTGFITLDALQWLSDLGVALLLVGLGGKLTSAFIPGGLEGSKTSLHRQQAAARSSETGLRIARMLVGQKLHGQGAVLEWLADRERALSGDQSKHHEMLCEARSDLRFPARGMDTAESIEEVVEAEKHGAEVYWRALAGIPLRWTPRAQREVPEHWLRTQPRESFRTGNRNGATDPTNALLNFGYALLEAETRIACLNAGLHPGLGIFHADRNGRASFIYDLMEPARPELDRMVLEFIRRHTFDRDSCYETREGFCRLDPELTAVITSWTSRLGSSIVPTVRRVVLELNH